MTKRDIEDLLELIDSFLSGQNRSQGIAADIEGLVLECFPDEPWSDDVGLALAQYAPGGGRHYFDEDALAAELRPVALALKAALDQDESHAP